MTTNFLRTPTTQQLSPVADVALVESETNDVDCRENRKKGGAEGRHHSSHHVACWYIVNDEGLEEEEKKVRRRKISKERAEP